MAATIFFSFSLLVKKKSCSYKSKHFDRVLDLRDSKFDVYLTGTLTGNTILENQIWPPVKIEFCITTPGAGAVLYAFICIGEISL